MVDPLWPEEPSYANVGCVPTSFVDPSGMNTWQGGGEIGLCSTFSYYYSQKYLGFIYLGSAFTLKFCLCESDSSDLMGELALLISFMSAIPGIDLTLTVPFAAIVGLVLLCKRLVGIPTGVRYDGFLHATGWVGRPWCFPCQDTTKSGAE